MLNFDMKLYLLLLLFTVSPAVVSVNGADDYRRHDFPQGFVFGAATSAYQVEGAASEDGRTPSIFDTSAKSGAMGGGDGDVACNQYHKYKEDVQLMVDTGLDAYRFSISWSRLIPGGRGPLNPKGLQYYNNLIDELTAKGIQPHVTLVHIDLPQALEDEYGGFVSRRVVEDFTAYADVCFRMFGDRVKYWTTFNEANIFVLTGYDIGLLPPQRCSSSSFRKCSRGNSSTEPYLATHNILLAHASAARLYNSKYKEKQKGLIGINLFGYSFAPSSNSTEDIAAVQRAKEFHFGWYLDPLTYGDYPAIMKKNAGLRIPTFTTLESRLLKGSLDFIGLNYYSVMYVEDDPGSLNTSPRDLLADSGVAIKGLHRNMSSAGRGLETSSFYEFPVTPWGLQLLLEFIKQDYGNPPIFIHENGQRSVRNSSLEDWSRVELLRGYIGGLLDSIRNRSNTRGYFTWSLMDVLEPTDGYESAYGLYYVDLDDPELRRQPKLSARWYSRFLKGGSIDLDGRDAVVVISEDSKSQSVSLSSV
ncbi:hypothetical protein MLD38_008165 [Melastoma candidum]|uniref:Uncharacterized protein n=1 Tax=Melastoma candidum TaxID=119954 RepID=A0ACB9RT46_9MYRT|nr:hypothetical protein MLD38_008165 [Melastoma candidum]